jgi:hypothetical protein
MDNVFLGQTQGFGEGGVTTDVERSFKRSRVMSMELREIVGPGYSAPTCTPGQRRLPRVTSSRRACPLNPVQFRMGFNLV